MPIQGLKMFKGRTLNITPVDDYVEMRFSDDVLNQFYKYYRSEYDAILQYRRMKLVEDKIDDANRPTMYFGKKVRIMVKEVSLELLVVYIIILKMVMCNIFLSIQ